MLASITLENVSTPRCLRALLASIAIVNAEGQTTILLPLLMSGSSRRKPKESINVSVGIPSRTSLTRYD